MKHPSMLTRLMAAVLIVLMLGLTACAGGDTPADTTAVPASTTAPVVSDVSDTTAEPNPRAADPLPADLKFAGETVRFITRDRDIVDDEISVDAVNGEITNDAIFRRQQIVEERLGVTFAVTKTGGTDSYAITNQIKTLVLAQSDEYDILANAIYATIINTGDGLFHNLEDVPHLNLGNPWWSQGFNAEASIGQAQYMATGDIALSLKRLTFVTFFNKKLFEDYNISNIYDTVRAGKWTLDAQGQIAAGMYSDVNGNQTRDLEDKYGFMANNNMISIDPYWSACDLRILGKNAENTYEFVLDNERFQNAVTAINSLFWECDGSFSLAHTDADDEQNTIASRFGAGDVGMVTLRLIEAEGSYLRDMTDAYGILPIPKLDETIPEYYSYAHDQFSTFGVPSTLPETRMALVGAVLEFMAYESMYSVSPAYYETALKYKYASDPDSGEMLDIIFENFRLDAGIFYSKNIMTIHGTLRGIVGENKASGASELTTKSKMIPKMLDKMQQKILELG